MLRLSTAPSIALPAALPAALCAVLLFAGCSDDEPEGGEVDRAAVEQGVADLYAGDHASERDAEDGACFAAELLDRAGVERLRDAGIVTEEGDVAAELPTFDDELAALWVDAQLACVDWIEESTRALSAQTKGKLDPDAYATCLREALTDEEIRAAVEATLTGSWDAPKVTALTEAQGRCTTDALPPE